MARDVGRNEPCPCGSGRKYKHCCLKANDVVDFAWRQLRAAEGRLVPELLDLALNEWGSDFVDAALDEFFLWEGIPEHYEETEEFSSFFVPWFVFEFVDDPHDPDHVADAPDESLAALYLRRHSERLSSTERAFLESASMSPVSFYAVTGIVPGREIALHDVLTGRDVVVLERSASRIVQAGGLLFTRVITVDAVSIMSGCAPLVIPPAWHHTILDFRARFARGEGRMLTPERVRDLDIEIRDLYFYIEDEVYNPRLPELRNTDGDRLVLTTLRYRLRCTPATAFERLKSLARAAGDEATLLLSDAKMDAAGALQAVSIPWSKKGNRLYKDWDNTTLGTIDIDGDRLEIHVNSARRTKRIRREIEKRLGADAVFEKLVADPIEKLLEERTGRQPDPLARAEQQRFEQQPEIQAMLRQRAEDYWVAWLDQKIPALGNGTPRQAAHTPAGRERLDALFAEFAWRTAQAPNAMSPDVPALRAKLGLPAR